MNGLFFMLEFEQKVLECLSLCCGRSNFGDGTIKIGVAVSGGADSVSLLLALMKICGSLKVITVNHNIRKQEETKGDADFVSNLCKKLKIDCTVIEIPRGKIEKVAEEHHQGIEEAARFLRYDAFEKFINENQLDYLCLAHNKNDQLETLLMRFLTGASLEASCGISIVRKKFIRPLLNISRAEIEKYLNEKKQDWRTDSTNSDESYLRNKIRLSLVPFLNEKFQGWQTAILSGAKKNQIDANYILSQVEKNQFNLLNDNEVSILIDDFNKMELAIRLRWLLKACSYVSNEQRIPSAFLEDFCKNPRDIFFRSVQIFVKNNKIFIKKRVKTHTESAFSDIIYMEGIYNFPFGLLEVSNVKVQQNGKCKTADLCFNEDFVLHNIELPCCVRSAFTDDEIRCADKSMKKICNIYSDWHVSAEKKSLIPIVQKICGKEQEIICIAGSVFGYSNWIVVL